MADDRDTNQPTRKSDDGHHQSSHTSGLFEEQKTSKPKSPNLGSKDNEGSTVKKRSVASDKELLAHDQKIRAWTQFIHTAITTKMQKQQDIDADDCIAIGEALVAVLAVQLTTLASDPRMAAKDFANGLRRQVDLMLSNGGN